MINILKNNRNHNIKNSRGVSKADTITNWLNLNAFFMECLLLLLYFLKKIDVFELF
jgi:hypothetical protein